MTQTRYIAYYRVSTTRQGADGHGIAGQQAAVKAYLQGRDHNLIESFIEVESGRNSERPRLGEALALARKLKGTLIIAKLDRLARSVSFIANLMDSNVEFVACDMPAANRLTLHIMAAVGEAEARMISERTIAALQAAKARGIRLGNPTNLPDAQAAGHRTMIQDADDHATKVVDIIRDIVRSGTYSVHKIADHMNERGIRTRRGGQWHGTSILNTIRRCGFESVGDMVRSH
jgi:DNA invertase Pin-like site-specific DNA recombinase